MNNKKTREFINKYTEDYYDLIKDLSLRQLYCYVGSFCNFRRKVENSRYYKFKKFKIRISDHGVNRIRRSKEYDRDFFINIYIGGNKKKLPYYKVVSRDYLTPVFMDFKEVQLYLKNIFGI